MDANKIIEVEAKSAAGEEAAIKCKCNRCGWRWTSKPRPSSPRPTVCPHCHSYLWNRPKPKRSKKVARMGKKPRTC